MTEALNNNQKIVKAIKMLKKEKKLYEIIIAKTIQLYKDEDAFFNIYSSLGKFNLNNDEFEQLWNQKPIERGKVFLYGKEHDMPRFCKSFGESYTFSKREHLSDPIDSIKINDCSFLQKCIDYLKKIKNIEYNQILINWYPDNQSYIGAHSDDEVIFKDSSIFCFNYCKKARNIVLKRKNKCKNTKEELEKINPIKHLMENNTGYEMFGNDFQNRFTHEIPKKASCKEEDERRISLTFRVFHK